MKVIAGNAEGTGIARRPDGDESALDVFEMKFRLRLGGGEEAGACGGGFHGAGVHALENPIDTNGVEEIVGFAVRIAGAL